MREVVGVEFVVEVVVMVVVCVVGGGGGGGGGGGDGGGGGGEHDDAMMMTTTTRITTTMERLMPTNCSFVRSVVRAGRPSARARRDRSWQQHAGQQVVGVIELLSLSSAPPHM